MHSVCREVLDLFASRGCEAYFGEDVSQAEHALQTAEAARVAGVPQRLVVAALLHDVGHLLHTEGEDVADRGTDAHHEQLGAMWLEERFGEQVAAPVRLHVDAKRYLVATASNYRQRLSTASLTSLKIQGGPMTTAECRNFLRQRGAEDALQLRRWDEAAKRTHLPARWSIQEYEEELSNCAINPPSDDV